MKIEDLDRRMRAFEAAPEPCVLPGIYTAARIDGRNSNNLTAWQERGSGLRREDYERPGENPPPDERVVPRRSRIRNELELPVRDDYSDSLRGLISPDQEQRCP